MDSYLPNYFTSDLAQLRQDSIVFDMLMSKHNKRIQKVFVCLCTFLISFIEQIFYSAAELSAALVYSRFYTFASMGMRFKGMGYVSMRWRESFTSRWHGDHDSVRVALD
jgi:hypothetical protein